jgi:transcriptional regulator with GAF, ATPase, and Fis domain
MIVRNKVVGVLYHDNTHYANSFSDADLKLLSAFASQAAIALDHAEAYAEIQRLNQKLNEEKQYYKEQSVQNINSNDLIGKSSKIMEVLNKINQVADTETTVLILGETGVGKGLVAKALHLHSKRNNHPFIKVLCNALPDSLICSELFGHEKGAFTGSVQRRIGRFELADGGTIFLDEIGDLQLDVQAQLLQVLQSKEFERVGGSETIKSNFRLITATNRDLADAVKNQRFRSDLYYRLNVFPIYVPPLRDRKEDIPILVYHFLKTFSNRMGKIINGIPKREMEKMMQYDWPGNVRELESIIERGTVLSQQGHFRLPELNTASLELHPSTTTMTHEENERLHILQTLKKTGWKVRGKGGAAEILDIHYSTLFFRMKKLGIQRPPDVNLNLRRRSVL